MARRQQLPSGEELRRALQVAPQLQSFILPNVRPTGRQLGGGSYGTVEELEMDGLICAGKKLYNIDTGNQGAQRIVAKYYDECSFLSAMRHPNIVQFLGLCFLPDSRLPVLVMERLLGSLDDLLENTADIPFSTKVSILQDVTRGLAHLHNHRPSVIHRDLSSRNVLLDAAMTAKIADLGNSRIADIPPSQLAQAMTQGIPGTLVYMPPEARSSTSRYGPPLDMFSFGHLALFTANQVFPKDLLPPNYQDTQSKKLTARTEIERREQYISMLHSKFGKTHPLVALIKSCLAYEPEKRPTASQALERLEGMRAAVHDPYSGLNRLQLEKSLAEKEAEVEQIPQLRSQLEQVTTQKTLPKRDNRSKDEQLAEMEAEALQIPQFRIQLEQVKAENSGLQEVCRGKEEQRVAKDMEITTVKTSQSASAGMEEVKEALIAALQTELRGKDRILQAKPKVPPLPRGLSLSLPVKWKKSIKMPSGVRGAQAVVVRGKVYIGGGSAEGSDYKILEYTIEEGQWREIETPVKWFGMAVVNNQLLIIGGMDEECRVTNQVWALDSASGAWAQPFPATPTARGQLSAVGYKRWVLVVGGHEERCVEVLDTTTNKWYVATPLPDDAPRPSLTVIQDTVYVVWGRSAVSLSIPILISDAVFQRPTTHASSGPQSTEWKSLPDTPTNYPTTTSLQGSLFAVGGDSSPSSIAMYLPHMEQWLKVAQLPTPRRNCTCAILPETQQLMVIGGMGSWPWNFVESIDLCTL